MQALRWKKLGLVDPRRAGADWAVSHAAVPTPVLTAAGNIRVYYTGYDALGRGRPGFVEVSPEDPLRVLRAKEQPLLDIGRPGAFDDNGLMATTVIDAGAGRTYMYYAGFELCHNIRYRILTGLAVSTDGGESFVRHSEAPVLERSGAELFFRCGAFARQEDGLFRLWYVAGSEWTEVGGKDLPVYDLRYMESVDGIVWPSRGELVLGLRDPDEHGFGRPWIDKGVGGHRMFFSVRKRSLGAYRLGFAHSKDGRNWVRDDGLMGLPLSPGSFDSNAMMFSSVISVGGRTYCFYNGDKFGEQGFGAAVLEA